MNVDSINDACFAILDISKDLGVGIELFVRPDGRVTITIGNRKAIHADLLVDGYSDLPLPGEAFRKAVRP